MNTETQINLLDYIKDVKDFPKEGIIFKDITPILLNPKAYQYCLNQLLEKSSSPKIKFDKIVGVESRGFWFGPAMAQQLNVGFVPVRKKGKLPGETISQNYNLEYGQDALEIHKNAICKGDRILIHDDLLASGGTVSAVEKLVAQLGGEVVGYNFVISLDSIFKDRSLNAPISSVLTF